MKVILIKNVPNLGHLGEVKQVNDGFARNYLLPHKLVKLANDLSVREMAQKQKSQEKSLVNRAKKFKEIAKKINNIKIIVKVKADEKKTLFGSINAQKIVDELAARNYKLESKYVKLEQPIKSLGYYDVLIDFGSGVTAKVGLTVTRED